MSELKRVYYIKDGRMHSGGIMAEMGIEFARYASYTMEKHFFVGREFGNQSNIDIESTTDRYIERPGRWYYLTGQEIIHSDDCFDSPEDAAEDYKQRLLKNANK